MQLPMYLLGHVAEDHRQRRGAGREEGHPHDDVDGRRRASYSTERSEHTGGRESGSRGPQMAGGALTEAEEGHGVQRQRQADRPGDAERGAVSANTDGTQSSERRVNGRAGERGAYMAKGGMTAIMMPTSSSVDPACCADMLNL